MESLSTLPPITRTKPNQVYFIQDGHGHIKIGTSTDPSVRLEQLQVAASTRLTLIGSTDGNSVDEARLHTKFRDLKTYGEWFFGAPSLWAYIKQQMNQQIELVLAAALGQVPHDAVEHILDRSMLTAGGTSKGLYYWTAIDWEDVVCATHDPHSSYSLIRDDLAHQMREQTLRALYVGRIFEGAA